MKTIDHWIGGKATAASSTGIALVFNPATGAQAAEVLLASEADVDLAVDAAAHAFETWSQASLSQRAKVLRAFRELVFSHVDELAGLVTDEHGKVLSDAAGEVQRGLEVVEFACGTARRFQREVKVGMIRINVPIPVLMAYYSFAAGRTRSSATSTSTGPKASISTPARRSLPPAGRSATTLPRPVITSRPPPEASATGPFGRGTQ